jgi:hypothetical protein
MRKSAKQCSGSVPREGHHATSDAPEKVQFRERLPDLVFASRMQGTLPETVTAGDLAILNSGLRILFTDLRRARQRFQEGEGYGRAGAKDALGAVWRFIMLFDAPRSEALHMPILTLQDALRALDKNNVLPVLKPIARRGRARSSDAREALKGHVAGTVQRLKSTGLKLDAARRRVAKELGKLGVRSERGGGEVTANRHWCDVVSADVGRRGLAAYNYNLMFTDDEVERFSAWPSSQAQQKFAVASLADFVRENFPELRGSQKPS